MLKKNPILFGLHSLFFKFTFNWLLDSFPMGETLLDWTNENCWRFKTVNTTEPIFHLYMAQSIQCSNEGPRWCYWGVFTSHAAGHLFELWAKQTLRGFDPLLLFFMNEIKIVSISFSSSVIEYNSNEKLLEAWSGARFYKNQHYVLSWYEENLTQYKQIAYFFVTH